MKKYKIQKKNETNSHGQIEIETEQGLTSYKHIVGHIRDHSWSEVEVKYH